VIYSVFENNVTDEAAYKEVLPEALKITKDGGGIYIAGGFNKSVVDHGGPAVANRLVIIRFRMRPLTTSGGLMVPRRGSTRTRRKRATCELKVSTRLWLRDHQFTRSMKPMSPTKPHTSKRCRKFRK
jgi:hypothetical protein